MTLPFERYVALGDSICIDSYPGLDYVDRHAASRPPEGLGAVSLLHRNDDALWPAFEGRDLARLGPAIRVERHEFDGATTHDVLELQLPRVTPGEEPTLVTLTVGGNDLLGMLGSLGRVTAGGLEWVEANLETIVDGIHERLSAATLLLGTIYDPSDGAGVLGDLDRPEAVAWLERLNGSIRSICANGRATLIELHGHFMGHGMSAPPDERWYWAQMPIEPGWFGASEVRRLWLDALHDGGDGAPERG